MFNNLIILIDSKIRVIHQTHAAKALYLGHHENNEAHILDLHRLSTMPFSDESSNSGDGEIRMIDSFASTDKSCIHLWSVIHSSTNKVLMYVGSMAR